MGEIDDIIAKVSPNYRKKDGSSKGPASKHQLVYDSATDTLEPLYFWFLDQINDEFDEKDVEKITDNFASSPGSGHFSELRGKASQMQQEASRVLGTVNNILKGVLNLIYDLKEFKIRLSHYDAAKSGNSEIKQAGILALKQMWMDKVDIQRGQGSLNAMTAGDLNFVTLRDSFLASKSIEDVKNLDLNDRVKRILKPRLQEFFEWRKRSEEELRKRYEIEKTYLKSQVDALKLNARWAKPYLRNAERLSEGEHLLSNPALVTAFNTVILEICLMAKKKVSVESEIIGGTLPEGFKNIRNLRDYYSVIFIQFIFRGIPGKAGQHYVFGGRAEANFKAYSLNNEELELFKEKLSDSDLETSFKLVEGMTKGSLDQIKIDLDELLEEKKETPIDINPFTAIASMFNSKKKEKEEKEKEEKLKKLKEKGVKPDSYAEKYIRNVGEANAMNSLYAIYDIYKKSHGMASLPATDKVDSSSPEVAAHKFLNLPG